MSAQRFRKKQVEVKAVQWTGENVGEVGRLLRFTGQDIGAALARHGLGVLKGNYIIRDPDGYLSVLSEPTFLDRYEPAPQPSSNEEKLRKALAWAIGWIEHCSENPLEDEEPEDYEARLAALALLRGKSSPFETHAGRCISCGRETASGEIECERCAAAPFCFICDDTGSVCAQCGRPRARCSCGLNGASEDGCSQRCAAQKRFAAPREETP